MKKRKVVSLVLVLGLSTSLLSGCASTTQTNMVENTESIIEENIDEVVVDANTNTIDKFDEMPDIRIYEPYEHIIMMRYNLLDNLISDCAEYVTGLSITAPEGYEILEIEDFQALGSKIGTSQSYGIDVWYVNTETVEVTPVFNEAFDFYDYSQPGKVIKIEETNDVSLGK